MPPPGHVLPSRAAGVTSRAVGDEHVVIDAATGTAHALTGVAARVWSASVDGAGLWTDEYTVEVDVAVDELVALGLLVRAGMSRRDLLRRTSVTAAGVGITSMLLPDATAAATVALPVNQVFTSPNTCTVFTVPPGVTYLNFVVNGAGGGVGSGLSNGGGGASVSGRLVNLVPGTTITVVVGAAGVNATTAIPGAGGAGYAPGGAGADGLGTANGGGGGGASAIGKAPAGLASCTPSGASGQSTIAVVAGGGAGSGTSGTGGNAGVVNQASSAPQPGGAGAAGSSAGGGGGGAGATPSAGGTGTGNGTGGKTFWDASTSVITSPTATVLGNGGRTIPITPAGNGSVTLTFP